MQQDPSRPLKIVHAIFTRNFWGSERAAVELANHQSRRHDVTLMVRADCDRRQSMSILDRACEAVRIVRIPGWLKSVHMVRHVLRLRPDIVHAHLGRAARLSGLVLPWVPRVATLHVWKPKHYDRQDALICISDWQLAALPAPMRARARLVRNFIVPHGRIGEQRKAALRREAGVGPSDFVVGFAGRLSRPKGFDLALAAFRAADLPDAKFVVVGEGELRPLIAEAGDRRIVPLGYRTDVKDLYQIMDVLVMSSPREDFGLVLVEAMDAGCQVIASRSRGPKDILEGQTSGFLFEPGDADDLVRALRAARARRDDRPVYDLSPFDIDERAADIERLYLDLLEDRRRAAPPPGDPAPLPAGPGGDR